MSPFARYDEDDGRHVRRRLYMPIRKDQFRVLHLLPGEFSDNIQCILAIKSATLRCQYEALSYEWGDETSQPWIQVTLPVSPLRTESMRPTRAFRNNHFARWLILVLWMAFKWASPGVFWCLLLSARVNPLRWILPNGSLSEPWYLALATFLCGIPTEVFLVPVLQLIFARIETGSCGLLQAAPKTGTKIGRELPACAAFERVQVTKNLALALRYLRRKEGIRTLWVDALCIDQENTQEKYREIRRMSWIYSNASSVIAWLGGYHTNTEMDACSRLSSPSSPPKLSEQATSPNCQHYHSIRCAFTYISNLRGWQSWFRWYAGLPDPCDYSQSRGGLVDLATRGWWQRLWVVQEAALATSSVQLQCGYDTCEIAEFWSAHRSLLLRHPQDDRLKDELFACGYMCETVRVFRFSARGVRIIFPYFAAIHALRKLNLLRDTTENVLFHDLGYWSKLVYMLFRTAGHFQCRDDEDRVSALLGIATGHQSHPSVRVDDLLTYLGAMIPRIGVVKLLYESCENEQISFNTKIAAFLYLMIEWQITPFVTLGASYPRIISFNGPRYVIPDEKRDKKSPYLEQGRVATLCTNAKDIITNTGTCAILEAASCGNDRDADMPSWVPNWSRNVGAACSYSWRPFWNKDPVARILEISENGRRLTISALPIGNITEQIDGVEILSTTSLGQMHLQKEKVKRPAGSSYHESLRQFLTYLGTVVLPIRRVYTMGRKSAALNGPVEGRKEAAQHPGPNPARPKFVWAYSKDGRRAYRCRLSAGEGRSEDQLVFLPDCVSSLVLRRQDKSKDDGDSITIWNLVGLVDVIGDEHRQRFEEDWSKLLQNEVLPWYAIE